MHELIGRIEKGRPREREDALSAFMKKPLLERAEAIHELAYSFMSSGFGPGPDISKNFRPLALAHLNESLAELRYEAWLLFSGSVDANDSAVFTTVITLAQDDTRVDADGRNYAASFLFEHPLSKSQIDAIRTVLLKGSLSTRRGVVWGLLRARMGLSLDSAAEVLASELFPWIDDEDPQLSAMSLEFSVGQNAKGVLEKLLAWLDPKSTREHVLAAIPLCTHFAGDADFQKRLQPILTYWLEKNDPEISKQLLRFYFVEIGDAGQWAFPILLAWAKDPAHPMAQEAYRVFQMNGSESAQAAKRDIDAYDKGVS